MVENALSRSKPASFATEPTGQKRANTFFDALADYFHPVSQAVNGVPITTPWSTGMPSATRGQFRTS